jgi:hypothetical protein
MQSSCNTRYPSNIVRFRYINVNTLHTGDKKDSNNDDNKNNNTCSWNLLKIIAENFPIKTKTGNALSFAYLADDGY